MPKPSFYLLFLIVLHQTVYNIFMDFASCPITCFTVKRPEKAKKYPDAALPLAIRVFKKGRISIHSSLV